MHSASEVKINCPRCGHPNFYFNPAKGVGFCHRDRCHWSPGRTELLKHVPDTALLLADLPDSPAASRDNATETRLPEGSAPLFPSDGSSPSPSAEVALQRLSEDRGISREVIKRFNVHHTDGRVIVPVYLEGELRAWLGRAKWWLRTQPSMRYKYPKGVNMGNLIFSWDAQRLRERVLIVENTFNAMWLTNIGGVSIFGSHLTSAQVKLISTSRVSSVAMLLDEGAERGAEDACTRLRACGVPAAYGRLRGQPDDHSLEAVEQMAEQVHRAARSVDIGVDF